LGKPDIFGNSPVDRQSFLSFTGRQFGNPAGFLKEQFRYHFAHWDTSAIALAGVSEQR
jgi:hypothetical protein